MDIQIMQRASAILEVMQVAACGEPQARFALEHNSWNVFDAIWRIRQDREAAALAAHKDKVLLAHAAEGESHA